jgi:hypothetical protein
MWIPHFGLTFWERDGHKCKKSESDKTKREYIVSFFLEDTDNRNVNDSDVKLPKPQARTIHVEIKGKLTPIPILFQPNKKQRLRTIRCKVPATNKVEAIAYIYHSISLTLSFWALVESSATTIWAVAVSDEKYDAHWEAKPQTAAAFELQLPKGLSFDKKFNSVLSLYREGRTSRSPFYRFFCFAKILEGFYAKGELFRNANTILKKHKEDIKKIRGVKKISRKLLVYALAYPKHKELEQMPYTKFWIWIRDRYRHLVGHAFPDKYTEDQWLDYDDYALFTDYAIVGNIVDLVIRDLLKSEFDIYDYIIKKGYVSLPKEPEGLINRP